MQYLDNLIAWGDQLFRAGHDRVDQRGDPALRAGGGDARAAAAERVRALQPRQPKTLQRAATRSWTTSSTRWSRSRTADRRSAGAGRGSAPARTPLPLRQMLYFCIPPNDKLLGYWDTVDDRLFKIRHCMNIEGVVRQLPLFEPPIDPALLVQAAAAGVDLGSALADIARRAALPLHARWCSKALESAPRSKSLGAATARGAREAGRRGARAAARDARDALLERDPRGQASADRRGGAPRGARASRAWSHDPPRLLREPSTIMNAGESTAWSARRSADRGGGRRIAPGHARVRPRPSDPRLFTVGRLRLRRLAGGHDDLRRRVGGTGPSARTVLRGIAAIAAPWRRPMANTAAATSAACDDWELQASAGRHGARRRSTARSPPPRSASRSPSRSSPPTTCRSSTQEIEEFLRTKYTNQRAVRLDARPALVAVLPGATSSPTTWPSAPSGRTASSSG